MEQNMIPRMRTAPKIVAEIKALDPETEVTEYYVRQLVKAGAVPVVWAGNKALINLNDVLDLLRVGAAPPQAESPTVGGIRRIDAKRPR
ncbi:hypothetical protein D1159_03135 [Pseudoflavonifractor sp. 524-17]|uniref:hypothetical protein n=1 Tax=Pseudoflavonifractor sp. 524-17 TaxID=2304577 RepID=UPI00137B471F|nr:hypothetical protein [Pseudoflavonifractor sp. 524-17]NCE63595.1 hypothetical protein [Pseudoflavonifractor sp. 524-17]